MAEAARGRCRAPWASARLQLEPLPSGDEARSGDVAGDVHHRPAHVEQPIDADYDRDSLARDADGLEDADEERDRAPGNPGRADRGQHREDDYDRLRADGELDAEDLREEQDDHRLEERGPFMFVVAPRGRTTPAMCGGTPRSCSVCLMLVGSVAFDELVENAVTITGAMRLKNAMGE